jgi:hypothetical protein
MIDFCHIAPTQFLNTLVGTREAHLTLAHLVETDEFYAKFYSNREQGVNILDNSAFEMYKQGRPMYDPAKLVDMGKKVEADYIVMSDYPAEHSSKTIAAAIQLAPIFRKAGFGTFFVPQSQIGDKEDLINAFDWASTSPYVDYIGVSILGVPNAYGVERGNKLQRFVSRYMLMLELHSRGILDRIRIHGKKIHFLGMVDGPNEIKLMTPFARYIDTWDSSAAVWAGLNGIEFDKSPTGLIDGKFEAEVDFALTLADVTVDNIQVAKYNIEYIDSLCVRHS